MQTPPRPHHRVRAGAARCSAASLARSFPAAFVAVLVAGCGGDTPRLVARHAALVAERDALREYLATDAGVSPTAASEEAGPSSFVPFADALVVIRRSLVHELVDAALPIEGTLSGRYRLRVDSARVTLRPGLALVELTGRASLATDPGVFADVTLLGAFEVGRGAGRGDGAEPREGDRGLGGRIRLFGIETRDVRLRALSPPAERLVDGLARVRLAELDELLGEIQIPVRLDELVELPSVEVDEVTIPAATLPLGVRLDAVRVLEEGIFVSLAVERAGAVRR